MITVAIPFYNAEAFLPDAIRSVFAQTVADWELLLVDDGSTDGSLDIARSVKDPRVRVLHDGENRKLASRLNQIAAEAKYPILARMDADDMMSPRRFEIQYEILRSRPEVDLVSTSFCTITDTDRAVGVSGFDKDRVELDDLFTRVVIVHPSVMGRTRWFRENPYDPSLPLWQDSILWIKSFLSGTLGNDNLVFTGEPLLFYRAESSVTPRKKLRGLALMRRFLEDTLAGKNPIGGTDPAVLRRRLGKVKLKARALRLLTATGLFPLLIRTRHRAATPEATLQAAQQEIDRVLKTRVPGLDGG